MTDDEMMALLRDYGDLSDYTPSEQRTILVSLRKRLTAECVAGDLAKMAAERLDALAARVERLTKMEWNSTGSEMSLGAIQFGSIWNGTTEYETPGWRAVRSNGDHVGVYATEAEARAALEAAAREATR